MITLGLRIPACSHVRGRPACSEAADDGGVEDPTAGSSAPEASGADPSEDPAGSTGGADVSGAGVIIGAVVVPPRRGAI